jgi:hypothetical protein
MAGTKNDLGHWFFLNTGSYSSVGDSLDQISDANDFDLTGRITRLPVYRDDGRELVHLGLFYLHGFRNDAEDDPTAQASKGLGKFLQRYSVRKTGPC